MKYRKYITLTLIFLVMGLGFAVRAYPGAIVYAFSDSNQKYTDAQTKLISESKYRIENMFGSPQANPVIRFFNNSEEFWPVQPNSYGSTGFLGSKTCILIGPKGQNFDVMSHELMHAEIVDRVGYWNRLVQLPVWFDEGLAMQTDFRARYDIENFRSKNSSYIKRLWFAKQFFVSDDEKLTENYAHAKVLVSLWVNDVGRNAVFRQLDQIKTGKPFNEIFPE